MSIGRGRDRDAYAGTAGVECRDETADVDLGLREQEKGGSAALKRGGQRTAHFYEAEVGIVERRRKGCIECD